MSLEDITKMKELARFIEVDEDKPVMSRGDKDRINRFLNDKEFENMNLKDLLFILNTLSTVAKKWEVNINIPNRLRTEIPFTNEKLNIFMEKIVNLQLRLKEHLEDSFYLNRVEQGKMTMRDFDEGEGKRKYTPYPNVFDGYE